MPKSILAAFAILASLAAPVLASDKMGHRHSVEGADHKSHGMTGHGKKMEAHTGPIPHDLDTRRGRITDLGLFEVDIESRLDPLAINKMHSWMLQVRGKDGKPVEGARIAVDGGMPQHGHGLPTAPRVTKDLGGGRYLLEGMRFNMTGWWEVKLAIDGGDRKDSVTFNLVLK